MLISGVFNLHYDDPQKIFGMKDLLSQFDLEHCVHEHTHKSGHIVDWIIQREKDPLVKSASVCFDLTLDH